MHALRFFCFVGLIFVFSGCAKIPSEYHGISILEKKIPDYYLLLLVSARHLDYSSGMALLKTISKHPDDWSKNGDVGHAWMVLKGIKDEKSFVIEGGHSGELGLLQPCYFGGVVSYQILGDSNPVSYLWEAQRDGFFQKGAGGHLPTYALKITMTKPQFEACLALIDPSHYDYKNYSLVGNQCCSFVSDIARLVGLELDYQVTLEIPKKLETKNHSFLLWEDPQYSLLTVGSPDVLEKSMKEAFRQGKAEDGLYFYQTFHKPKRCLSCKMKRFIDFWRLLPSRLQRASFFRTI